MNKEELVHLAACTNLNSALSRYVARVMDESNGNGHTEYTTPIDDVKEALGTQMVELGEALQGCASTKPLVIDHRTAERGRDLPVEHDEKGAVAEQRPPFLSPQWTAVVAHPGVDPGVPGV